jgi:spore coat protein U-like protein
VRFQTAHAIENQRPAGLRGLMMKQKLLSSSLIVALIFGLPLQLARAATYSNGTAVTTFNVTLTLNANCSISANPLNFGSNSR